MRYTPSRYQIGGLAPLALRTRGPKVGVHRRLTARQEQAIQRAITDTTPDQLRLPFALWTRAAIAQLIQRRFEIMLPVRTMGHYLTRWSFTAQKPLMRAYEQRPEAIAAWVKTEYPQIKQRALEEGAEIHWGDETGLSTSDPPRGRSFARTGKTPVRTMLSQRRSVSFSSAISNSGTLRFMVLKKAIDAPTLITFFMRLCTDAKRKVSAILDNLNVHKSRAVTAWLAARAELIEVFYLPSNSPELNPDEYLYGDPKLRVAKRARARTRDELLRTAASRLRSLQRRPAQSRSSFGIPACDTRRDVS
jgi:transposase